MYYFEVTKVNSEPAFIYIKDSLTDKTVVSERANDFKTFMEIWITNNRKEDEMLLHDGFPEEIRDFPRGLRYHYQFNKQNRDVCYYGFISIERYNSEFHTSFHVINHQKRTYKGCITKEKAIQLASLEIEKGRMRHSLRKE